MKSILKRLIPPNFVPWLKMKNDVIYYVKLMRKIEKSRKPCSFLFGTPIHTNLGDHLITLSERYFLNSIGYMDEIIEIPTEMYQIYKKRLIKAISEDSVIFINGGGWMGNLWPVEELLLQDMVNSFKRNRIIIFPQTIYYDKSIQSYQELINSSERILGDCELLSLFVRDRQSYNFAINSFKKVNVHLTPDIALAYFNCVNRKKWEDRKNAVGICLREDREASRDKTVEEKIRILLQKTGWKIQKIDTMSKKRISFAEREKAVTIRLADFSEKKIIVTDRLHGMIFAYLTGTPCIAMDNKTCKVSGVYTEWLSDCEYILPMFENTSDDKLLVFLDKIVHGDFTCKNCLDSKFEYLKEIVLNG